MSRYIESGKNIFDDILLFEDILSPKGSDIFREDVQESDIFQYDIFWEDEHYCNDNIEDAISLEGFGKEDESRNIPNQGDTTEKLEIADVFGSGGVEEILSEMHWHK